MHASLAHFIGQKTLLLIIFGVQNRRDEEKNRMVASHENGRRMGPIFSFFLFLNFFRNINETRKKGDVMRVAYLKLIKRDT